MVSCANASNGFQLTSFNRSTNASDWPLLVRKECRVPFDIQGNTIARIGPKPCATPTKGTMFGCSSLLKRPSSRRRTCHPGLVTQLMSRRWDQPCCSHPTSSDSLEDLHMQSTSSSSQQPVTGEQTIDIQKVEHPTRDEHPDAMRLHLWTSPNAPPAI